MDRKLEKREQSLRTLGEDELTQVAGGWSHHARGLDRAFGHGREGHGCGLAPPRAGGAPTPVSVTNITNDITIVEIVAGNTAPVTLLNLLGLAGTSGK